MSQESTSNLTTKCAATKSQTSGQVRLCFPRSPPPRLDREAYDESYATRHAPHRLSLEQLSQQTLLLAWCVVGGANYS
jgi:hypothetical protein